MADNKIASQWLKSGQLPLSRAHCWTLGGILGMREDLSFAEGPHSL